MSRVNQKREQQWRKEIDAFRASGLRPSEYCRKINVNPATLRYWRLRFGDEPGPSRRKTAKLVPVTLTEQFAPGGIEASVRLVVGGCGAVEIRGDLAAMAELVLRLRGGAT